MDPPGAPTAPIGDIAQGPGIIDRPQQTVPRNSQIANQIVRFTRNQPRTITSSNMQPTMQNSIVRFKPVAQPANPQTTSLQLNVSGKLGQLRLNPQILGANTNLSTGQTERFMAAMTRVQAIDDYLTRGGHLVFERSISDGGVAHYFPPGWGGNNGAVADEYNRLLQQPNVNDSYPAPDRLSVTEERNRLLAIRKNAEDEALSILENGRDGDRNPLIRPSGIQASLGDIAGAIGRVRLPNLERPSRSQESTWNALAREATAFNATGADRNPPTFKIPRIIDNQIQLIDHDPMAVPTDNEALLNAVGLSTADNGLLARGIKNELAKEATRLNNAEGQNPADAHFWLLEGSGMDIRAVQYAAHNIAATIRENPDSHGIDLKAVGLSTSDDGLLAKANVAQHAGVAEDYNKDAATRRPASVAYLEGKGVFAQVVADAPSIIRSKIESNRLDNDDLKLAGLSTDDNGLLAASLKNELGADAQHYNASALQDTPIRLAIVEGRGMDQRAVAVPPSEIQRRLANGAINESDLANAGLSTREGGILDTGTKKERLLDIETDPTDEGKALERIVSNPNSDSAPFVREAIEEGHAERLKKYVKFNGTDGIGSFARSLLDGGLLGGGEPPINNNRPVASAAGEPERSLEQLEREFRQTHNLLQQQGTHDRRHVLTSTEPNVQGEAMINAAEDTYLQTAMDTDLSSQFFQPQTLQAQLDSYRATTQRKLTNSKQSLLRDLDGITTSDFKKLHNDTVDTMISSGVRSRLDRPGNITRDTLDDIFEASSSPAEYRAKVKELIDPAFVPQQDAVLKEQFTDNLVYLRALRNANPEFTTKQLLEDPSIASQIKLPTQTELDQVRYGDGVTPGLQSMFNRLQ